MPLEFRIEELPDQLPVPPLRVLEVRIERKVAFIEMLRPELPGLVAVGGHVEYGKVQKVYGIAVRGGECEGLARCLACLSRRTKDQIYIGADACLLEGTQCL